MIQYTEIGEGAPVILTHGLAASRFDWEALSPDLAAAGWHCFAPDLLGHGDSLQPDDPDNYHCDKFYSVFENWLINLQLKEAPLLVGHSLGGYLSLRFTLQYPDQVRGLVLIDPLYSPGQISPALRFLNRSPILSGHALRLAPHWLVDSLLSLDPTNIKRFSSAARQRIATDYKRASPHVFHIPHTLRDLSPELSRLNQPALVIWGTRDLTLTPTSFPHLLRLLPNAIGHSVYGSGHQPHVGFPEIVNPQVLAFAQRLLRMPSFSVIGFDQPPASR